MMVENRVAYLARLKGNYFTQPDELKGILYTILVAAVILSFDKWGETTFDALVGIANLIAATVICAIGILVHDFAHRASAMKTGYSIEHKIWFGGLIFSLALVMATRGAFKLYLLESMILAPMRLHRIGRYPFLGTTFDYAIAYSSGPVASLLLAGIFAWIGYATGYTEGLISMAVQFNLVYGIGALLPLPPLDGVWIMYYSRGVYAGLFVGSLSYLIMTTFWATGIIPLITAIIIGFVSCIYWMKTIE